MHEGLLRCNSGRLSSSSDCHHHHFGSQHLQHLRANSYGKYPNFSNFESTYLKDFYLNLPLIVDINFAFGSKLYKNIVKEMRSQTEANSSLLFKL